jgi:acyl-CoA synthetase (AMP-forming)/AMP-acid ligase II
MSGRRPAPPMRGAPEGVAPAFKVGANPGTPAGRRPPEHNAMTVPEPSPPEPAADDPAPAFEPIAERIRGHARARPDQDALIEGDERLTYAELDALMDRVAAALQRDGFVPGRDTIAVCAHSSVRYAALFLAALRAGVALAPLAPSVTAAAFASMLADAAPRRLFLDAAAQAATDRLALEVPVVALDADTPGTAWHHWLAPVGARAAPVAIDPAWPFNIIYSSGTTGTPKGIVQPHAMRAAHVERGSVYGYGPDTVTVLATPLYSNTTLVVFFPTLHFGGTVVLMRKFDASGYLGLAERHCATHTMLVPVQYQRLMALPEFEQYELSSFKAKFCTSAPFSAALKADVLRRWPGALIEFYGMTEGGGTCILAAHEHPDKLHTVGKPAIGHDIRLIDEQGRELPAGATGEIVGRSPGMMTGYHGRPDLTAQAEWLDADGRRYIRTGDVGRFDEDGFLVLMDRRKDLVISGGFNVYPSDLETVLRGHPDVADAAVVGVPSLEWGETPVAFVIARAGAAVEPETLRQWANARLGKTQRIAGLRIVDELPRSAIGKVLKRELRDAWLRTGDASAAGR